MSTAAVVLGVVGSICGLVYCALGVAALKYLPSANEGDRTVGWTLWWCLETKRYTAEGQELCRKGFALVAIGFISWAGVAYLQRA
jgi:hypothetical protein